MQHNLGVIAEVIYLGESVHLTKVIIPKSLYHLGDKEESEVDGMLLQDSMSILQYQWIIVISSFKEGDGNNRRDRCPEKKKLPKS